MKYQCEHCGSENDYNPVVTDDVCLDVCKCLSCNKWFYVSNLRDNFLYFLERKKERWIPGALWLSFTRRQYVRNIYHRQWLQL